METYQATKQTELKTLIQELDEACEAQSAIGSDGDDKVKLTLKTTLTAAHVSDVVAKSTGIPVGQLMEEERHSLLTMETDLSKEVIGQEAAIAAISKCIRLSRAGLRYHDRPLGVFLMLGPTGTGKVRTRVDYVQIFQWMMQNDYNENMHLSIHLSIHFSYCAD